MKTGFRLSVTLFYYRNIWIFMVSSCGMLWPLLLELSHSSLSFRAHKWLRRERNSLLIMNIGKSLLDQRRFTRRCRFDNGNLNILFLMCAIFHLFFVFSLSLSPKSRWYRFRREEKIFQQISPCEFFPQTRERVRSSAEAKTLMSETNLYTYFYIPQSC